MAWTQTDLDSLEEALKSGILIVRFGDRWIEYQSVSEMLKVRQAMKDTLNVAGGSGTRCTLATFKKG